MYVDYAGYIGLLVSFWLAFGRTLEIIAYFIVI